MTSSRFGSSFQKAFENQFLNLDSIIRNLTSFKSKKSSFVVLAEYDLHMLCIKTREILLENPMLLELEAPVRVVGDLHGQFMDLLRIFDKHGYPPQESYLFLGDYVDRGKNSIETISLLFALKLKYPSFVHLLRGNHEDPRINNVYGFFDECKRRYTIRLFKSFSDCYSCLPVAATINDRIFCCHGGLSPNLHDINDINKLQRPLVVPDEGLLCDLLWSDPADVLGWHRSSRGVSYVFGSDVVSQFCHRQKIDLICRAHQVVEDGYEFFAKRQLITIFSAPNYCGLFDNEGTTMSVDSNLHITINQVPQHKSYTYKLFKARRDTRIVT